MMDDVHRNVVCRNKAQYIEVRTRHENVVVVFRTIAPGATTRCARETTTEQHLKGRRHPKIAALSTR